MPEKPLIELGGKPIIVRTYEGVKNTFEHCYVATDAVEIARVCKEYDVPVLMTELAHDNGTTRCLEAYDKLEQEFDYIVNVQGDEAFIDGEILDPLLALLEEEKPEAATLMAPLPKYHSNSNVFVVPTVNNEALYFSRHAIPFDRDRKEVPQRYQHVGVYAYTPEALRTYCDMTPTPAEQVEKLEQLRWLEHGRRWKLAIAPRKPLSIDTPQDLTVAKGALKQ